MGQLFSLYELRTRGGEKLELHDDGITYTVWISFAEIYNENIYDLFQKVPEVGGRAVHPDSLNPDPIRIQGFEDQKLKKRNKSENFLKSFFDKKNCNLLMSKLKEKPSALIREHPALQSEVY
jgi:hypothetical protein